MTFLSPSASILFRIIIGAIITIYIVLILRTLRQIILKRTTSKTQKLLMIILIVCFPVLGLLIYFSLFQKELA
jgi:hypothetical protein